NSKLKDPEERHRLATVFNRGLTNPSGFVLPVQSWQSQASGRRWRTEKWKLRRGHLYLVPGDSPVGYRLPLESLPYVPPAQYPFVNPADPTAIGGVLPDFEKNDLGAPAPAAAPASPDRAQPVASFAAAEGAQGRVEQSLKEMEGAVRTAIAVEPRDGRLCVFMPPVERVEDYLELVAAAESAARAVG